MIGDGELVRLATRELRAYGDPKPTRPVRLTGKALRQLHTQVVHGKHCRVCGLAWARSMHHIVPRSLGGDDVPENLVELCGDGTRGCHGSIEANVRFFRSALRAALSGAEIAYVLERKGQDWLDRYYPESKEARAA